METDWLTERSSVCAPTLAAGQQQRRGRKQSKPFCRHQGHARRQLDCSQTALFWNVSDVRWIFQAVNTPTHLLPQISGPLGCLVLQMSQLHLPLHFAHDLCRSSPSSKLCFLRPCCLGAVILSQGTNLQD